MEHHIYLTFLSALRSDIPFNRMKATRTIIQTNIFPPLMKSTKLVNPH